MDLPPSPRLASLVGAGAGAGVGTRALLSAFSTGGTTGTGKPSGALSTGPVMSLLFGRKSWGLLLGFTYFQAGVPRCLLWYWRSSFRSFNQALAISVALPRLVVSLAVALSPALSNRRLSVLSLFSAGPYRRSHSRKPQIFRKHNQQSSDRSPDSRQ